MVTLFGTCPKQEVKIDVRRPPVSAGPGVLTRYAPIRDFGPCRIGEIDPVLMRVALARLHVTFNEREPS